MMTNLAIKLSQSSCSVPSKAKKKSPGFVIKSLRMLRIYNGDKIVNKTEIVMINATKRSFGKRGLKSVTNRFKVPLIFFGLSFSVRPPIRP